MTKLKENNGILIGFISILAVFIIWELSVLIFNIPSFLLPKPTFVLKNMVEGRSLLLKHASYTVIESIIGLIIAILISVLMAVIMDISDLINKILSPLFVISQTIPLTAVAPLFVIWFGFGIDSKILVVILVCFFPITVSILNAFKTIDDELLDLMSVMNITKWQLYQKVKLPYVLPAFFSGLKISTTYAVIAAVIAEWMGAKYGLGVYLARALKSFNTSSVFGIIIVIVLVSVTLVSIIQLFEKYLIKYQED